MCRRGTPLSYSISFTKAKSIVGDNESEGVKSALDSCFLRKKVSMVYLVSMAYMVYLVSVVPRVSLVFLVPLVPLGTMDKQMIEKR